MATSMSQNLKEVMLKRKNWHAPVSMQLRERVSKDDLKDITFTIDQIIVCNRVAKDEDGKVIMTKDGQKEIYQPQVYIAFDGVHFSLACLANSNIFLNTLNFICKDSANRMQ